MHPNAEHCPASPCYSNLNGLAVPDLPSLGNDPATSLPFAIYPNLIMLSPFIPAGELLGPECQIRTAVLAADPYLPSGEYAFLDTYCTDNTCDCRKTIIQIFHDKKLVSIVSFGWVDPKFYLRWLKSTRDRQLAKEMSGVSIDFSSPDIVSRQGILLLVNHLMDKNWISKIKENYRLIRKTTKLDNIVQMPLKITRNATCPCGSGKKYKNCCL